MSMDIMRDIGQELGNLSNAIKDLKSIQMVQSKPNKFVRMPIVTHDFRKTTTSTADDAFSGESETLLYKNKGKKSVLLKSIHLSLFDNVFDTTSSGAAQPFDRHVTITHKGLNRNYPIMERTRIYLLHVGELDQSNIILPLAEEYDLNLELEPEDEIFVKTEFKIAADSSRRMWQAISIWSGVITEYEPAKY